MPDMKIRFALLSLLLTSLLACSSSEQDIGTPIHQTVSAQTPVVLTVEQTVISEVPVTVEVTRQVTREVEVIVETTVEVEITRLVERVVTATPTPTSEPTDTPVPTDTPIPQAPVPTALPDIATALLQTMIETRINMESFGGLIDVALTVGVIDCQVLVDTYDSIANTPTFDVSGQNDVMQYAYNGYRTSVQIFADGARDMTQNCREFLANPSRGGIPRQQWGPARQNVNNALDMLHPAIQSLDQ